MVFINSHVAFFYKGSESDLQFHCQPNIVHYGGSKTPGRMEAGQVFTIVSFSYRLSKGGADSRNQ
jgi:hypothetical protein